MSQVERIGDATLYCGDCREILPTLEPVEAVVTDPPYGIGHKHKTLGGIIGDDEPFDPLTFLVAQNHIFWGANHYASKLPDVRRWLVWLKHDPGLFGKRNHAPFDLAWTDLKGSGRAFKHIWDASIREGEWFGKPNCHPHQKPTELMVWCLEFIPTAETILDPFMGSGPTGVACMQLGRKFVGIEIEPRYFDIACKRIEEAQRQGQLFQEPRRVPKANGELFMEAARQHDSLV